MVCIRLKWKRAVQYLARRAVLEQMLLIILYLFERAVHFGPEKGGTTTQFDYLSCPKGRYIANSCARTTTIRAVQKLSYVVPPIRRRFLEFFCVIQ